MTVDYIALWNEQHEAANRQKQIGNDGRSFWEDPENIRRFVDRLMGSDRSRIEGQLAAMRILGSTVLDIGAGPGRSPSPSPSQAATSRSWSRPPGCGLR